MWFWAVPPFQLPWAETYKNIFHEMATENDIIDILWDENSKDPFFDLELIEIPKNNFDLIVDSMENTRHKDEFGNVS